MPVNTTNIRDLTRFLGKSFHQTETTESFLMNGRQLATHVNSKTIQVPDVQRTLDGEKVDSIIQTFKEKQKISQEYANEYIYTLGTIQIAVVPCDESDVKFGAVAASTRRGKRQSYAMFLVVDGQHRLHVLTELMSQSISNVLSMNILVTVKRCDTHQQVETWFHELNKSTPLPNYLKATQTSTIQHRFIRALKQKLEPLMPFFSKKKSNKATSFHWDEWLDEALQLDTLYTDTMSCKDANDMTDEDIDMLCTDITERLIYVSNRCREIMMHDVIERKLTNILPNTPSTRKKIMMDESYFVLALKNVTDWRDMLWDEAHQPTIKAILKSTYKKKKISQSLRMKVWQTYHPTVGIAEDVECPVPGCINQIKQQTFHCGHKIAEVHGGALTVNNLIPICNYCNSAMGTKSFCEYEDEMKQFLNIGEK